MEVLVEDVVDCSRELVQLANDCLRGFEPQPPHALVYRMCSLLNVLNANMCSLSREWQSAWYVGATGGGYMCDSAWHVGAAPVRFSWSN
jgi:hypothetical protein